MAVFRLSHTRHAGGTDVVEVGGDLDASVTARLSAVVGSLDGSAGIVIDLAGATLVDASAVGALRRCAAAARDRGVALRVVGAQGPVLQVLEITGTAKDLGAYLSRDEAVAEVAESSVDDRPAPAEVAHASAMADSVHRLLHAADALPAGDPRRAALRERAVEEALPYARRLASRYRYRGEPAEDLNQVAAVGLVKAVNGYRPERTTGFLGYATPTILGELRRHFRDAGWTVRVPRRVQELRLAVNKAAETLTQALGRRPGPADLASFLDVPEHEVLECLAASQNYHPVSLSTPVGPGESHELADAVGAEDPRLDLVEYRHAVGPLLASLTPHEREVLALRFFGELTQSQIAARVGSSQMHVSRLLTAVLGRLRGALAADGAQAAGDATRSASPRRSGRRPVRRPRPATPS